MERQDVEDKFRDEFHNDLYIVNTQEFFFGSGFAIAIQNRNTKKRQAVMIDRLKTVGGTFGLHYDDFEEKEVYGIGPPYQHERVGLMYHGDKIDQTIKDVRKTIG